MDKGHTLLKWPPHSYENLYFLQEHYESVVMSSQMVDQIRSISTLMHKVSLRMSDCMRVVSPYQLPSCLYYASLLLSFALSKDSSVAVDGRS